MVGVPALRAIRDPPLVGALPNSLPKNNQAKGLVAFRACITTGTDVAPHVSLWQPVSLRAVVRQVSRWHVKGPAKSYQYAIQESL